MQGTQYATKRSIFCRGAFCGSTLRQPHPRFRCGSRHIDIWFEYIYIFGLHESKQGCKDQEPTQPRSAPDLGHQRESNKLTARHHKQELRGQPPPSRRPQGTYKQTRTKVRQSQDRKKYKRSTALERSYSSSIV